MTPNRAARRPPGHACHAAWRPRPADDGLSGVAFESDTDGALVTGSRCIRPAQVERHRKGDDPHHQDVADAEIVYQAQGSLGKPRSGILTRVLGVVWP